MSDEDRARRAGDAGAEGAASPADAGSETRASSPRSTEAATDERRRELVKWLWRLPVVAAVGGGGYGLYRAIDVHFLKRRPDPTPEFVDAPPETVAALAAFASDWDSVEFLLASTPAVAMRVPGPVAGGLSVGDTHLVAFSRVCTHQMCIATLNTDVNAIGFGFNYDTTTPAITCPCHLSVFDPLRAGQAVSGPAILPLPRARLELRGEDVVATGWELPRG